MKQRTTTGIFALQVDLACTDFTLARLDSDYYGWCSTRPVFERWV